MYKRHAACIAALQSSRLGENLKRTILVILYSCMLLAMVILADSKTAGSVGTEKVVQTSSQQLQISMVSKQAVEMVEIMANDKRVEKENQDKILYMVSKRMERESEWEKVRKEQRRLKRIKKACGVEVTKTEQEVLERIVEAESGNQDIDGRIMVANVILNRVKSKQFPNTISEVVFQYAHGMYQFSPVYDGRYYSVTVSSTTRKAVKKAMYGKDLSRGALYFMAREYADASNVSWFDSSLTWLFIHGGHEFYK